MTFFLRSKKLLFFTILSLLVVAILGPYLLFTLGPRVLAKMETNANLVEREQVIEKEYSLLSEFEIPEDTLSALSIRKEDSFSKRKTNAFSDELLTEYTQLYNDILSEKEVVFTQTHMRLEDKVLSAKTKINQIKDFGSDIALKEQELMDLDEKIIMAQTKQDFAVAEKLLGQLDFFLQNLINTKKTMFLQEHLATEVENIKNLISEGKKIGVKDKDFENLVDSINIEHSSANYLFQLEKYETILIDKKIVYEQKVEKKKQEMRERQLANTYIPIKTPKKYFDGKSIEVNLSEQVIRLYEDGEQIMSDFVVTGKSGWETTPGQHKIFSKRRNFFMRGDMRGQEWEVWTNYASFFTYTGEAVHDSPWRRSYGPSVARAWNGSHGCVNSRYDLAQFVYNWSNIGTPVYVYY